jgi:hypothetical protein
VIAAGDALLFVLSARRTMSRSSFRDAYESLWLSEMHLADEPLSMTLTRTIDALEALGHCERGSGGELNVTPASLAILPWPGLPRAVLCGARSPETLTSLRAAARRYRARVTSTPQGLPSSPVPSRIELSVEHTGDFDAVGAAAGCIVATQPPALSLASVSASLDDYLESLEWAPGTELDWPRSDFVPAKLRFDRWERYGGDLRLSRYQHPDGYAVRDYLWKDGLRATADRSWGRFAVLAAAGIRPLGYERLTGTVSIPVTVPLPRLLARALTLCSGWAPHETAGERGFPERSYAGVPAGLAAIVEAKLAPPDGSQLQGEENQ